MQKQKQNNNKQKYKQTKTMVPEAPFEFPQQLRSIGQQML